MAAGQPSPAVMWCSPIYCLSHMHVYNACWLTLSCLHAYIMIALWACDLNSDWQWFTYTLIPYLGDIITSRFLFCIHVVIIIYMLIHAWNWNFQCPTAPLGNSFASIQQSQAHPVGVTKWCGCHGLEHGRDTTKNRQQSQMFKYCLDFSAPSQCLLDGKGTNLKLCMRIVTVKTVMYLLEDHQRAACCRCIQQPLDTVWPAELFCYTSLANSKILRDKPKTWDSCILNRSIRFHHITLFHMLQWLHSCPIDR